MSSRLVAVMRAWKPWPFIATTPDSSKASGKSSGRITSVDPSTTARSIALDSSRILPGQSYAVSNARASVAIPLTVRLHFAAYLRKKYDASSGMSLTRNGGATSVTTFRR